MTRSEDTLAVSGEIDIREYWDAAVPYRRFAEQVEQLQDLWAGVYRLAKIPDWAIEQARRHQAKKLLVINEDWCWDAANTVPIVAKLSDVAGGPEIRVISRDDYPDLMSRYLTNGTRSIPVVIALDERLNELGWWGPRPRTSQEWAIEHKTKLPKDEFYIQLKRQYAKDKGESTLREVLELFDASGET